MNKGGDKDGLDFNPSKKRRGESKNQEKENNSNSRSRSKSEKGMKGILKNKNRTIGNNVDEFN